jgi:hypothetical protein
VGEEACADNRGNEGRVIERDVRDELLRGATSRPRSGDDIVEVHLVGKPGLSLDRLSKDRAEPRGISVSLRDMPGFLCESDEWDRARGRGLRFESSPVPKPGKAGDPA